MAVTLADNETKERPRVKSSSHRRSTIHERSPPGGNTGSFASTRLHAKDSPSTKNPVASRSESRSTPILPNTTNLKETAKESTHFLRGINVNNCQDILSIPSPPSPSRSYERMRQRRLSMSLLANKVATPLQDMTNTGASPLVTTALTKAERNRKRRSLCHVPSPLEDRGQPALEKPSTERLASIPPRQHHLVLDGLDENDGRVDRRKKRSSNRRQTMILKPNPESTKVTIPQQCLVLGAFDYEAEKVDRSKKRSKRRHTLLPKSSLETMQAPISQDRLVLDDEKGRIRKRSKRRHTLLPKPSIESTQAAITTLEKEPLKRRETLLLNPILENTEGPIPSPRESLVLDVFDDDETELVNQSRKSSSKRRQSILLPSECSYALAVPTGSIALNSNAKDDERAQLTKLPQEEVKVEPDANGPSLADLRKLVRGYCSLRTDSQHRTECAKRIKAQTGYSLCRVEEEETTDPEVISNRRKALWKEVGPSVQQMEEEKTTQVKDAELSTGCTVEKTRGGKYRYRDATGKRVSSAEYMARYTEMIAKKRQAKAETFRLIRQQLDDQAFSDSSHPSAAKLPGSGAANDKAGFLPSTFEDENDDMDCDDTDMIFEHGTPKINQVVTDAESAPLCMQETPLQPQVLEDNAEAETKEFLLNTGFDREGAMLASMDEEQAAERTPEEEPPTEVEEEDCVLPIPSREDESEDPEIAQAERRLWQTIDTALEQYSSEVIAIRTRRRAQEDNQVGISN